MTREEAAAWAARIRLGEPVYFKFDTGLIVGGYILATWRKSTSDLPLWGNHNWYLKETPTVFAGVPGTVCPPIVFAHRRLLEILDEAAAQ